MAKTKQVLKFLLVLSALMAVTWWLDRYDIHPYDNTAEPYSDLHQIFWILLTLSLISGLIHVIAYWLISNRLMFTVLKLPAALLLTLATSIITTGEMFDWRILYYLSGANGVLIIYYPFISIVTVFSRYRWLRNRGRLGTTKAIDGSAVPKPEQHSE